MGGARGQELVGGRVGRFNRRFEGIQSGESGLDWMELGEGEGLEELNHVLKGGTGKKGGK